MIMKERPSISITPVMPSMMSHITSAPTYNPTMATTSSGGKTLQEKLADKQKQLSTKQLGRSMEAEILGTHAGANQNVNISSVPGRTTLHPYKFPLESGISISPVSS